MDLQTQQAMDYYRKTVLIDPTAENAWLGGVRLLLQTEEYEKALGVVSQAHETLPNSGRIAHALAKILAAGPDRSLRDGPRALPLALTVFQADPSAGHARTVAMAYAESGECDEASKWQQRAMESLGSVDEGVKTRLQAELSHYESGEPCQYEAPAEDTTAGR